MPRMDQLSSYATTVARDGLGDMVVTYHATPIVRFNPDRIVLATGGYDTVTTRRKMNQAANQFRLPYGVHRMKGESLVSVEKGWRARLPTDAIPVEGPAVVPLNEYVELLRA